MERDFRELGASALSSAKDMPILDTVIRGVDPSQKWNCTACGDPCLVAGYFGVRCIWCDTVVGTSAKDIACRSDLPEKNERTGAPEPSGPPAPEAIFAEAEAQLTRRGAEDAGSRRMQAALATIAPAESASPESPPPSASEPAREAAEVGVDAGADGGVAAQTGAAGQEPSAEAAVMPSPRATAEEEEEKVPRLEALAREADKTLAEARRTLDHALEALQDATDRLRKAKWRLREAREESVRARDLAARAARGAPPRRKEPFHCPPCAGPPALPPLSAEAVAPAEAWVTPGTRLVANRSTEVYDELAWHQDKAWREVATLKKGEVAEALDKPVCIRGIQMVPLERPRGLVDLALVRRACSGVQKVAASGGSSSSTAGAQQAPVPQPRAQPCSEEGASSAAPPRRAPPAPAAKGQASESAAPPPRAPPAPAAKARAPKSAPRPRRVRPRALLFGDSITEESYYDSWWQRGSVGWVTLLQHHLKRRVDVLNYGYSGYNTRQARAVLPKILEDPIFDEPLLFAVVMFGANDATLESNGIQHVPLAEYKENLAGILEALRERGCQNIIVLGPSPVCESKWPDRTNQRMEKYAMAAVEVASAARSGVQYKSLFKHMRSFPDYPTFMNDGLHLSAKGHKELFALLQPLLPALPQVDFPENTELSGSDYLDVRRGAAWHPNLRELGELDSAPPPEERRRAQFATPAASEDAVEQGSSLRPAQRAPSAPILDEVLRRFREALESVGPHALLATKEEMARALKGLEKIERERGAGSTLAASGKSGG